MGITLRCCQILYNSTYSYWNKISEIFFHSCIQYILFCKTKEEYLYLNIIINQMLDDYERIESEELNVNICNTFLKKYITILDCLDIKGIYYLMNQPDNTGKYIYENSIHISTMIHKVQPFVNNTDVLNDIILIHKLFKISYEVKEDIIIS